MSPSDAFDVNNFLDAATTEQGSTKVEPIPAGEYTAIIADVKSRLVTSRKDGSSRPVLDIVYNLSAPELAAKMGRQKLEITDGIFPDVAGGKLDMAKGKNIKLNRLRDACGLNTPGQPFAPRMLIGKMVKVSTKVDPDDSGEPAYARIVTVGKAA